MAVSKALTVQIRKLFKAGTSLHEIARVTGVARWSVRKVILGGGDGQVHLYQGELRYGRRGKNAPLIGRCEVCRVDVELPCRLCALNTMPPTGKRAA